MNTKLEQALKRAKQVLGEDAPEPEESVVSVFDKLVSDARAYLVANESTIDPEVVIEIKLSKDDFEVAFERS